MVLAIAQLLVVQAHLLLDFLGLLFQIGDGNALFFSFLYFFQNHIGHIGMLVQVVV